MPNQGVQGFNLLIKIISHCHELIVPQGFIKVIDETFCPMQICMH
ncbi:MAG: hypothetical protein FD176_453 [Rhodospirillaceae bacterium]|nr:MAG: hypothetical protein FD176_453 [Rhodospirillaceae bacterium]TNC94569.1 MAG: hypothetical protein FD119_3020 [Stygiobacter sp.]